MSINGAFIKLLFVGMVFVSSLCVTGSLLVAMEPKESDEQNEQSELEPDYYSLSQVIAQDGITLVNSTKRDVWVNVKVGGTVVKTTQCPKGITKSIMENGRRELFDGRICARASISFKKYHYEQLTMRAFPSLDAWEAYDRSYPGYLRLPEDLIGVKTIEITYDEEDGFWFETVPGSLVGVKCCSCSESIEEKDNMSVLSPCLHEFHAYCLAYSTENDVRCPICRKVAEKIIKFESNGKKINVIELSGVVGQQGK